MLIFALCQVLGAGTASATFLPSPEVLAAILGVAAVTEDFEAFDVAPNAWQSISPTLDATTEVELQGPGLVLPGISIESRNGSDLVWEGVGRLGAPSQDVYASNGGGMTIGFATSQRAVGLNLRSFEGSPSTATVEFFSSSHVLSSSDEVLVGSVTLSLQSTPTFVAFEYFAGVSSISLVNNDRSWSPIVDDLSFDQFPCTEQGILDAVAAGYGPHTFGCIGPTTIATSAPIVLENNAILDGGGLLTVDGGGDHRVFVVPPGSSADLRNLTIRGGSCSTECNYLGRTGDGGGILAVGSLSLVDCSVSHNASAGGGGGISAEASLTIRGTTISHNQSGASGGGISSGVGPTKLSRSEITSNQAGLRGGGVDATGALEVSGTEISGNTAIDVGGGINIEASSGAPVAYFGANTVSGNTARLGGGMFTSLGVQILNSTISGNTATGTPGADGSGLFFSGSDTSQLQNSTIAGNVSPGSSLVATAPVLISNTLLADSCGPSDDVTSLGGNLESPGNSCGFDQASDQVGVTVQALSLGPLQDNGGNTPTRALAASSIAVGAGEIATCTTYDQRGWQRLLDGACDIGAYEASPYPCSEFGVRRAVADGGGPHTFDCDGPTVLVTADEIVLEKDVMLDAQGKLTLDGYFSHRLFYVNEGVTAELKGMTLMRGISQSVLDHGLGGGIFNRGTLALTNTTLSSNRASFRGGGILNLAHLTLSSCSVSDNSALDGGGVYSGPGAVLSVRESTLSGNRAGWPGGSSPGRGGGLLGSSAEMTITNSTFSANAADASGNELRNEGGGSLRLVNSTISASGTGAAPHDIEVDGSLDLVNTVLAGDCQIVGSIASNGGNLESPGDTCGLSEASDQVNVTTEALKLGPLQDNGGPTLTHALLAGSVAIDDAVLLDCPSTDQRGAARPQAGDGGAQDCDIGAFEVVPSPAVVAAQLTALGTLGCLGALRGQSLRRKAAPASRER